MEDGVETPDHSVGFVCREGAHLDDVETPHHFIGPENSPLEQLPSSKENHDSSAVLSVSHSPRSQSDPWPQPSPGQDVWLTEPASIDEPLMVLDEREAQERAAAEIARLRAELAEAKFHQPGRDPNRERDQLRKVLDLLSAHKDCIIGRRMVQGEVDEVRMPEGPNKGAWVRCTIIGRGNRPDTVNVRLVQPGTEVDFTNVPSQALRRSSDAQFPEWYVHWQNARRVLLASATSQLIRDQFGAVGLRIFNLLNEHDTPQKFEERDVFSTCMVPPAEGREVLNEMVRSFVICWQEVPKSANTPLSASHWLYYVDRRRIEQAMIHKVMQATLNLRIRFRVESARVVPLESRQDSLTPKERLALREGRRTEDILERSFLVLDAVILIIRCF